MASLLSMAPFGQCNLFLIYDAPGLCLKMLNVVRFRSLTPPASIVATVRWLSFYSIKFTLVGFPQLRNKKTVHCNWTRNFPENPYKRFHCSYCGLDLYKIRSNVPNIFVWRWTYGQLPISQWKVLDDVITGMLVYFVMCYPWNQITSVDIDISFVILLFLIVWISQHIIT